MNAFAKRMTVCEFVDWASAQSRGRYELMHGVPVAMSPERALHRKVKHRVAVALEQAIAASGCDCFFEPDGATVVIDEHQSFEPDALVYYGPELPPDSIIVPNPIVVVEVTSLSTERIDSGTKLIGYFKVASVCHYLVVDLVQKAIVHHARRQDGRIDTRVVTRGVVRLDPPGISIEVGANLGSAEGMA